MSLCIYDSLLTLIILASWSYIFRTIYKMQWAAPTDARDLAAHCSQYVIPAEEFSDMQQVTSGNAFVVAHATYQGRTVVLKRWHGALVEDDSRVLFVKRLVRDLDRWRALAHPNIAPVLGVALHISNLPALVVPYNRTLAQFLAENPSTDVLPLMQGVAAGLSYLHAQDPPIPHGDLKGSSVFVSPSGTALLSDVGIAAIPQPPDWTFRGIEDARWLAPEVMDLDLRPGIDTSTSRTPDGRLPVTCESDVYAFGMLALQMHTRAPPFAPARASGVVIQVVLHRARPPRPPCSQLTDVLWALMQQCWAHDFRERPTIAAVAAWLGLMARMRAVGGAGTADGNDGRLRRDGLPFGEAPLDPGRRRQRSCGGNAMYSASRH
ncbi:kinase-like domain-containing protein [Mycena maculata]|uniref:Kinase-like domain-containing protein n=1 Tax=Mycena maculata TaxID=230809 RepID=A0AAD7KGF5_9AGAR|nr:kinase-like domain-containing protein [Mycena maculata]